jgi:hypothetical protein
MKSYKLTELEKVADLDALRYANKLTFEETHYTLVINHVTPNAFCMRFLLSTDVDHCKLLLVVIFAKTVNNEIVDSVHELQRLSKDQLAYEEDIVINLPKRQAVKTMPCGRPLTHTHNKNNSLVTSKQGLILSKTSMFAADPSKHTYILFHDVEYAFAFNCTCPNENIKGCRVFAGEVEGQYAVFFVNNLNKKKYFVALSKSDPHLNVAFSEDEHTSLDLDVQALYVESMN